MKLALGASLAAAGAGLMLGVILGDARVARVKAELAGVQAEHAFEMAELRQAALELADEVAAREQEMHARLSELEYEHHEKTKQTMAELAAADAAVERERTAVGRLREQARAGGGGACGNAAGTDAAVAAVGPSESGRDALDVFAELLAGRGAELVALGGYADALKASGQACEQAYDAVRAAR